MQRFSSAEESLLDGRQRRASVPLALVFAVAVLGIGTLAAGLALLENLSFWLAPSLGWVALVDLIGLVLASLVGWLYARISRAAVLWLLPWLVWMPITTALKLWGLWGW